MPTRFAYEYTWTIQCTYCFTEVSDTESMLPGCEPLDLPLPKGWFQLYPDMLLCPAHTLQVYVDDELLFVRPRGDACAAVHALMGIPPSNGEVA